MFSVYFIIVCILRQNKIVPSDLNSHCWSVALHSLFKLFCSIVVFIRYSKFDLIASKYVYAIQIIDRTYIHFIRCLDFSSFSVSFSSRGVSLVLLLGDKVQFIVMTIDNEIASIYLINKFRCCNDDFYFRGCHTSLHVS